MMKKKFPVSFICLMVLALSGCGRKEADVGAEEAFWYVDHCIMEDGILVNSADRDVVTYYDEEADAYFPLCAKANCRHDSSDCMAYSLSGQIGFMWKQGDTWYYQKIDNEGGRAICSCDLDGSNEKKIASFPYDTTTTVNVFYDDVCLIAGQIDHFDPDTWEWTGTVSGIYRFYLDTGETEEWIEMEGVALEYFWDDEIKTFMIYGEETKVGEDGFADRICNLYEYMEDGECRLVTSDYGDYFVPYLKRGDELIGKSSKTNDLARLKVKDFLSGKMSESSGL